MDNPSAEEKHYSADFDSSRFASLIADARTRAATEKRNVLVSMSFRTIGADPLEALGNLFRAADSDSEVAAQTDNCMYWAHPRQDFAIAGIGAAAVVSPSGTNRFAEADAGWNALVDGALVDGSDELLSGLGPILMGGFSFDPGGPSTEQWRGFPAARLVVPMVSILSVRGDSWMTVSSVVEPDGRSDVQLETVEKVLAAIVAGHEIEAESEDCASDLNFSEARSPGDWHGLILRAVNEIKAGSLEKVVLARSVNASADCDIDGLAAVDHLRTQHQDAFVFALWSEGRLFAGASPERLVRLDGRDIQASSLAGTAPRGETEALDAELAAQLAESAKDRSEHAVVRDALAERLGEVCDVVDAPSEPVLLTLSHVHHLHTAVRAHLKEGYSLLDVVGLLHPTPAVGGTPREAALEFIREYEPVDRGWYAAPIGWVGRECGEFAVALRSAVIDGSEASLFAGCGIVGSSDPELEYAESVLKLQLMRAAIEAGLSLSPHSSTVDR